MGMIPRETIDNILDRSDIVEILSDYVQLKRSGRNFKACCPFHNEKTPSFVVSPDKQIYHCFGCHAGGNVIDFLMKHESLEFPEAVRVLASKAGVEIPETTNRSGEGESVSTRVYEANKVAGAFYRNMLNGEKGRNALKYLNSRGITSQTVSTFGLGYAPDEWESLSRYCRSKKISVEILRKAGLTVPSDKGRNDYDRFRSRIIFPIYNERDTIVAFGGRVMDNRLPKYINSPETPVYSKSNILYGLNFSKKGIREKGYAVLVEGYLDVIMPFQHGVINVVATSGTALTLRQVDILKKYTDTVVMVFDSDQAGEAASLRGLEILVENGLKVKVATLPKGDDPDSFVSREGSASFYAVVEDAKTLFDYKLDLLFAQKGKKDIGAIVDGMLPTIAKISNAVIQSDYIRTLAEKLGIHEASLRVEMGKIKSDRPYRYEKPQGKYSLPEAVRNSELYILGLSLASAKRFSLVQKELGSDAFRDPAVRTIMSEAKRIFDLGNDTTLNQAKLLGRLRDDERARNVLLQAMAKVDIIEDPDKAVRDCISCLKKENREERLKSLAEKLKQAQVNADISGMNDTLRMIDQIHKERVV
ncbi:MAG: DNA primase [Candidatus Omnitrophota bacterium]